MVTAPAVAPTFFVGLQVVDVHFVEGSYSLIFESQPCRVILLNGT